MAAFPTPLTIDINYDIILFYSPFHPGRKGFYDFMNTALAGFVWYASDFRFFLKIEHADPCSDLIGIGFLLLERPDDLSC
jgi:hypothetical protein